jgi:hypothetical protein
LSFRCHNRWWRHAIPPLQPRAAIASAYSFGTGIFGVKSGIFGRSGKRGVITSEFIGRVFFEVALRIINVPISMVKINKDKTIMRSALFFILFPQLIQ